MNHEKNVTVQLMYSETSKNFFIDFWDNENYLVSLKLSEVLAQAISKKLDIKIMTT